MTTPVWLGCLGGFPALNPEEWEARPSRRQQGKLSDGSGFMCPGTKTWLSQELSNKHKLKASALLNPATVLQHETKENLPRRGHQRKTRYAHKAVWSGGRQEKKWINNKNQKRNNNNVSHQKWSQVLLVTRFPVQLWDISCAITWRKEWTQRE